MIDWLKDAFRFIMDVQGLIEWGGTLMVCAIVFIETGFFVGFFLPGDSLLVSAGVFAAAGHLNVTTLLIALPLCAIAGDQVGYLIGRKAGHALYRRENSFLFRKQHLIRAHEFYEKYGGKTVVLARFVPIVRTFAPPVAGAAGMAYRRYLVYDIFGGFLWIWSMVLTGFSLGSAVPDINRHIHIVIAVVVLLSLMPAIIEALRHRSRRHAGATPVRSENELS